MGKTSKNHWGEPNAREEEAWKAKAGKEDKVASMEQAIPNTLELPRDGPQNQQSEDDDFDSFYLRRVTAEFADDIEKLRNAPDFKDSSVSVLVAALKQPAANLLEGEKRKGSALVTEEEGQE